MMNRRNILFLHFLTPCLLDAGLAYAPSDFLVKGIEHVEPAFNTFDGTMYSGLLPIDIEGDDEPRGVLSFWLFAPNEATSKDSLTIWLNGGPGCSSFAAGLLLECSPVTTPHYEAGHPATDANQPLIPNQYSWTKATNLLFVEQPTGVGFSRGPIVDSEADVAYDFYNFLVNFFDTFQDMSSKSLYIVGESYAGMYVPSIAHYIHKQNKKGRKQMNLSGIALGNGWIDAMVQGPTVIDYAYWHGMIDSTTKETLYEVWDRCKNKEHMDSPFHDFTIPDECNIMGNIMHASGAGIFPRKEFYAPNGYDVTTWDNYPVLNAKDTVSEDFFNNPKVRKALNFESVDTPWQGCIPGAGRRRRQMKETELSGQTFLAHDRPESMAPYIADLLDDAGIRVLVYGGDRDLTTNLQGSEMVLNNMSWSGHNEWRTADRYLWTYGDDVTVGGYVKTYKNLDLLLVLNSGHLLPYNVPQPALDLITRLTSNASFDDILLPNIEMSIPRSDEEKDTGNEKSPVAFLSLKVRHTIFLAFVAIVCFSCGAFAGSRWNRKSYSYEPIPEVSLNGR